MSDGAIYPLQDAIQMNEHVQSPRSSDSWSGDSGERAPDIIDLDAYMRGARSSPSTPASTARHRHRDRPRFVVDAGLTPRQHQAASSSDSIAPPVKLDKRPLQAKHYSHDSGLSDGSYKRRSKQRLHRRSNCVAASTTKDASRDQVAPQSANSCNSMRAFQAVWERALKDQQAQISKVAELCERLTATTNCEPKVQRGRTRSETKTRPAAPSADSSEMSSSSRSTRDLKKNKRSTDECRTYKIIMNKLDEFNRLLGVRGRSPSPQIRPRRTTRSSDSLSASENFTEFPARRSFQKTCVAPKVQPTISVPKLIVVERAVGSTGSISDAGRDKKELKDKASRLASLRAAPTRVCDISPKTTDKKEESTHKIHIESVKCKSGSDKSLADGKENSALDLDNPLHFYEQARRLQLLHSSTPWRARSAERSAHNSRRESVRARSKSQEKRGSSLCAICRGYLRNIRHYIAAQIFCCPDRP